jgi:hypothetical protein
MDLEVLVVEELILDFKHLQITEQMELDLVDLLTLVVGEAQEMAAQE